MKLIKTEEAVGHVLCHDMTQIIKGVTKDARFRKGHIVTEKDIPVLLSMGKENLYVWEKNENMLHEDEAVEYLRRICSGEHVASGSQFTWTDDDRNEAFLHSGEKGGEACGNQNHPTDH